MKILLLLLLPVFGLAQSIEKITIDSKFLKDRREVLIYLPAAYQDEPERRFETVYVFDAQAMQYFDLVHSTVPFVNNDVPVIVVGIVSNFSEIGKQSRNSDFLPAPQHPETAKKFNGFLGNADNFRNYLTGEAAAYIDSHYRTLPYRIGIGHSNGGTFLAHCLLSKPDFFDAYLLISPNFDYDQQQMVGRLKNFDPGKLASKKFIFMCNANEGKAWADASDQVISLLGNDGFKSKIEFSHIDYSSTENHSSVFPVALAAGLKMFFAYQFLNAENLIAYYSKLEQQKLIALQAETINAMAYNCFWNGKKTDAIRVINWGILRFPKEHNLYDSQGEFYEKTGNRERAKTAYSAALGILQSQQSVTDPKQFEEKSKYYKNNIERVSK